MATYRITGTNHDCGAHEMVIVRVGHERAEWSADLLRQCGYRIVTIDRITTFGEPDVTLPQ